MPLFNTLPNDLTIRFNGVEKVIAANSFLKLDPRDPHLNNLTLADEMFLSDFYHNYGLIYVSIEEMMEHPVGSAYMMEKSLDSLYRKMGEINARFENHLTYVAEKDADRGFKSPIEPRVIKKCREEMETFAKYIEQFEGKIEEAKNPPAENKEDLAYICPACKSGFKDKRSLNGHKNNLECKAKIAEMIEAGILNTNGEPIESGANS